MKWLLSFLLAAIVIISCKDKKIAEKATDQTTNTVADRVKDSAEIRSSIILFYDWYGNNYAKLMKYDLYSGIKNEDAPPYKINWNEVERYQQFLRDSVPQLGEEFLKNQKHFFQQCDSAFKKDVEDDIPYGFDYDWYTSSQEDPQYTIEVVNTNQPWPMIEGDNARVQVGGVADDIDSGLIIYMEKENDKWKIAKIGNE